MPGRFSFTYGTGGIAVDAAGNAYVSDSLGSTIRKVSASGAVSTLAGLAGMNGSADGVGSDARFGYSGGVGSMLGMAVDDAGSVYLADAGNNTIRKVTASGVVSTLAGVAGICGSTDGTLALARFCQPRGLALDAAGSLYVADNYQLIRKISPAGVVTTLAGTLGLAPRDGVGTSAGFARLAGIAVDGSGIIYAIDDRSIRKITPAGVVTTLAGTRGVNGTGDGVGAEAKFNSPEGIAADVAGNVFVADSLNNTIRKITAAGMVTTLAGHDMTAGAFADGVGQAARFNNPLAIAVSKNGTLFVTDTQNYAIRNISPAGVVTSFAGKAPSPGAVDGAGAIAQFSEPTPSIYGFAYVLSAVRGVAVDGAGNIYVADTGNDLIRRITPDRNVTTLAGVARVGSSAPGSVDGIGLSARFNSPQGVAVDAAGNIFVADTGSNTIRKIDPSGIVTTFAGSNGVAGASDGLATKAGFNCPGGVAADASGNIYVADTCNNTIRKITAAGVVSTLAGVAGRIGSTNGPSSLALFTHPGSVAVDRLGNIYVAEEGTQCILNPHFVCAPIPNNTIRKVSTDGNVTTIAGTGVSGSANFTNVAVDGAGTVFVTDTGNSVIVKITPDAAVTTVAGKVGSFGVVLGDLPGSLNRPAGIAVDANGALYTISENAVLRIQVQ
jgi:sugar lactone lactonase YvrE